MPDSIGAASPAPRFRIAAAEARQLMKSQGCSLDELLQSLVAPASELARPPISNFKVGAAGATPSGDIFIGVNLEFSGMPLNNSVHAEQFLVANLRLHGETELAVLAVNAAPCGHCRQFFSELACAPRMRFLLPSRVPAQSRDEPTQSFSLEELLPMRFCPQDLLGHEPPPLLLQPQRLPLTLMPDPARRVERARSRGQSEAAPLKAIEMAVEQARESFAPYSHCPAGVALVTLGGQIYSGAYLESCAFNPGMQALQVALVDAVVHGLPAYSDIDLVVVAELEGRHVMHAPMIRLLLQAIAPNAAVLEIALQRADAR